MPVPTLLRICGLLFLCALAVKAQPANDNFVNAWTISGMSVSTNGNTGLPIFATKEPGEPNHAGFVGGRSVWFVWTAPSNGTFRVTTAGSTFNTLLAVYTGTAVSALTPVASNDNAGGGLNTSRLDFFANAGTTYRIAVDGRNGTGGGASSGAYNLTLQYLGLVQIASPNNNAILPYRSPFSIDVNVALTNPVTRVDFYWFGGLLGTDNSAPYSLAVNTTIVSTNTYFAVAVDSLGQSLTSAPVNVLILSEGITIVAPLDTQGYLNPTPIPITAIGYSFTAAFTAITNIEFFADGVSVGRDSAAPFSVTWNTVTPGAHRLSATGQDNNGVTHQAPPIWITVAQRLVASNSVWKYYDQGVDLGTSWRDPAFNDSTWAAGPAELGYGDDVDGRPEATVVSFGPDSANKYPTTYFRRTFDLPTTDYVLLILYVLRDDGAVAYLNGSEAARFNMPAGTITYNTLASNAQDDGTTFFPAVIGTNLLRTGPNTLAIELHQTTANSSDISFDLELVGLPNIPRNSPPLVAIINPTNNSTFLAPPEIVVTANATDLEGSVASVQFYADGFLIGPGVLGAGSEYSVTWTNPPVGWHTLYAIATDNEGAPAASTPVNVAIYDSAGSPLIQITAPLNGTTVEGPANVLLVAQASAPGRITNVEFYANGNFLGTSPDLTAGLRADYQFASTLASSPVAGTPVPPALANLGANTFTTAAVDGTPRTVLRFAANDGLSLAPASALFSGSYTLAALFAFDTLNSWRRILDFGAPNSDTGLYFINGSPVFYYFTATGPSTITTNTYVQVVATREATSSNVVVYLDGIEQFTFTDDTAYAVPGTGNALRLFRDDGTEASSGAIARFRVYDRPLAANQVAALDRVPATVGSAANYSFLWMSAPFGTNTITAVVYTDAGTSSTSAPITLIIKEPPINTNAPVIVSVDPPPSSIIPTLTSIKVTFSENVGAVDPWDLLINGQPAFSISGSGSNYTFLVSQPGPGTIVVSWATNHGIHDFGYPANLPFDELDPSASWTYQLVDGTPPTLVFRDPTPGSLLTNLTQINLGFSENVTNVDAADLLINGAPAVNLIGGGAFYTFEFPKPAGTNVTVTWAANHGITDLASPANPFDSTGNTWTYTLDSRTILVQSNGFWLFVKGTAEASNPSDAWRGINFNDSGWSRSLAPFYYGDPYNSVENPGTLLSDMQGGYTSIYLRTGFYLQDPTALTNLFIRYQSDDGFILWINGSEVLRYNMPAGNIPFSGTASSAITEPQNRGAPYFEYAVPNPGSFLVAGTNVVAIHAFNQSLSGSSDFGFNAQLYGYMADAGVVPPRLQSVVPTVGEVFSLTNITVHFTEPVTNVDAQDLLINGVPATGHESTNAAIHSFAFSQPNYGPVNVTWANGHGIVDFDSPPKAFDGTAPGASFQYTLVNPSAPAVVTQSPLAQSSLLSLTQITVTFSKAVTGVDAADLLINGSPAAGVSGSGANYTFTFPQPAYGVVAISWTVTANIQDLDTPANPFDPRRSNNSWSYTLVDQIPPRVATQSPPAGSLVTNLTQVTVTFSESVDGVNASDLLVNGVPATGMSGTNATYTFTFPQPNSTIVSITWANLHGIRDLATVPNAFDATAPGSTWTYSTPDNVAPTVALLDPPAHVTIRSLSQIRVTFSEPVSGVSSNDLLINSMPARSVSGSGAGPYTFAFLPPPNGTVEIRWAPDHGIVDLASTPNAFAGGDWTYTLNPNASFGGQILVSEIMFNPRSGQPAHEWIELQNVSSDLINLAGWKFTRGVDFTFPNVSIPAGGYLVVAADPAAFHTNYPAVANYIGGWTGRLANSDETIELRTALDEEVNSIHYATEGDWARREGGRGANPVTSITRNGTTATVTVFAHGYTGTDQVVISGADQPEYNGRFSISGITTTTFNITVSGTPASPATGNIICRQVIDNGLSGWSWFSAADGFGYSLELVNAALPNGVGQNWLPSINVNGTPGTANSVRTNNLAPLLSDVAHFPPIPSPTDSVAITARAQDELANGVQNLRLFYRNHTTRPPGAFTSANMFDDGLHGDGLANDGLYGAIVPPLPNGSIIEFYVQATDTSGLVRTWPAPARDIDGNVGQFANALYQVVDILPNDTMPTIRVVMTDTERASFPPPDRGTDAEMNVTMVSTDGDGTKIRYLCGVRIRGAGTRTRQYPNNRLNIPNDNRWNGLAAANLNGQFVHAQVMGSAVAQKSGLPAADAHVVHYFINGANAAPATAPANGSGQGAGYSTFLLIEPVNGDLAADLFPQDGDGNVYRASSGNHTADLAYQGTVPGNYLARGFFKTSNKTENDWSDLIALCYALGQVPNDADYFQAIGTNVNVLFWMRYFAVGTLMNFGETAMFNGIADDYALYRGTIDRRFIPIGHDFDTIFGQGDTLNTYPILTNSSIYIMINPPDAAANMPVLRRFMTNSVFAPVFFSELKRLADTVFNPSQLDPLFDQMLSGWGPTTLTINAMKTYAANRRDVVLSQIPLTLTVNHSLGTSNGLLYTTSPAVPLSGTSHAIDTRKVLVNGVAAAWSPWEARWTHSLTLAPGINRVLFQSLNSNNVEIARTTLDIWYDDGANQLVTQNISSDTVWTAAGGPYQVANDISINSGATLTIQAGATVYLDAGADIIVANGGRLLAQGADTARIRFSRSPNATGPWGGITINGGPSSPESRITYAHIEGNGSTAIRCEDATAFLDHLTFGALSQRYIDVDRASFVISDCVFPTPTAGIEMVHGTGGIKAGGHGIFIRNFFGKPNGYNDAVDFTGGNRPQPIVHFIDNVFVGTDDDILDLDGTDAWVEGNIFMHAHRNGASPDSSSAVSGGNDSGQTSEITIVGNLFYDCDQVANAKQGNFYTLINNTIVHQTHSGGIDTDGAVVIVADDGTTEGAGFWIEGNIIYDAEKLVRNQTAAVVTFTNNLMQLTWTGPGGNNSNADPLLKHIPQMSETTGFTSWEQAQIMREWFSLRADSPARGTGPNGLDKGGVIPIGASISGVAGVTPDRSATLRIGFNRPAPLFPNGSGYTHYKWRLDGGPWSAETPIATPISLSNLSLGQHFVEATAKRDSGLYQDDPLFGVDAVLTPSRTWTVNPAASPLRISEILAANSGALVHQGTTPDAIELFNSGSTPFDLTGVRLTDDPTDPDKYIFPDGNSLAPGAYLVIFANNADGSPGIHIGFGLSQSGDALYLYDAEANGGALLDSISFGPQLENLSIGRIEDGSWALTLPTFGAPNRAAQLGNPARLRINEWLALGTTPFENDFVEIYNPDSLPVALGGLYLSDEIIGLPARHQVAGLSFLRGGGYFSFVADGDVEQGPEHLNFRLSADQGNIGLFSADLTPIDCVAYQPQRLNISQGRSPNGGGNIVFFDTPTPGAPNPLIIGPRPNGGALVINEVLALNASLAEGGRTPDWIELYNGTTNTLSLSDLSLTDDLFEQRRFVFAAGVTIGPGQYLRVICDPDATTFGPLVNTNFALKSSGGVIFLFDSVANEGAYLDSITYGIQTADLSIGRVPDGGTNWVLTLPSPGAPNIAVPALGDVANLKVNEWMADPAPGDDDWFEIYNPNSLAVAIGGLYVTDLLSDRTRFQIAELSFIGSGTNAFQRFVADGNTGAGADHVGFSLRGAGEAVGISTRAGTLIDGYNFGRQNQDVSEGRFPDGSASIVRFPGTASPSAPNWRRLAEIVINEALTHTDEPLEDAVELRNLTAQPIDISGWWLSDDNGTLQKYQIPFPTIVPANGFAVIYENQFTNRQIAAIPFALSSHGDEVVLSAATNGALTGYRASVRFGAAANAVSFGRYITSDGREEFVAMAQHTFGVGDPANVEEFRTGHGGTNTYPRVGPIVISEIMYHPPDIGIEDNVRDEYIELRNISSVPVKLYDSDHPTNTWHLRDAVDFDFPTGTEIPPGGELLVVSFDPINNPSALADFRAAYNINPAQAIVGPYDGKLANDTDEIELRRPDLPDASEVPYILVERVRYSDTFPWPDTADGTGLCLHRVSDTGFGNDPTNFVAATPDPGLQAATTDTDGDGIPDTWEDLYGLDRHNAGDAAIDSDGDGMTNLQEYLAGTHPRDANSVLRLGIAVAAGQTLLTFTAQPDKSYSLMWKESVDAGIWAKLADIAAGAATRDVTTVDPLPAAQTRIYRVVTPQDSSPLFAGPAIISSPKAAIGNWGGEATFSVVAHSFNPGAGGMSYSWTFDGSDIPGASAPSLSLNSLHYTDMGLYGVNITDASGAVTASPVRLNMRPHIIGQPQNQLAPLGGSATFRVNAQGAGPLSYVWLRGRKPLVGETNASLLLTNVSSSDATNYSVVVFHDLPTGKISISSSSTVLTISP